MTKRNHFDRYPEDKYECRKCGKTHYKDSIIGKRHYRYMNIKYY